MDLGTVETKLIVSDPRGPPKDKSKMNKWDESKGKYNSVADFSRDVRQIWWNTARFNGTEHLVTQAAYRLDSAFTKALNNMPAEVSPQHYRPMP
jgi:bromodomain-containing factor 1